MSLWWCVAVFLSVWLLTVKAYDMYRLGHPIHGREPTIGFFGFLRTSEDGYLREAPELDNVGRAFFAELAATKREHPCAAKSIFGFAQYRIDPLFLVTNTRASLESQIKARYPDAKIGIWAFVGATGNIEELHETPLIEDLVTDSVASERASEQTTRAFNKDASTRITAVRYGAKTFGAIYGYAPATVLSEQEKNENVVAVCASSSADMLRQARGLLEPLPGFEQEITAHKLYWEPALLVARAKSHRNAGRYSEAARLFAEAAMLNPLYPYTSRDDYLAALQWLHAKDDLLGNRKTLEEILKKSGMGQESVEMVAEYFRQRVPQSYSSIADRPILMSLVEVWEKTPAAEADVGGAFRDICDKWPKEPLIYVHWGDWEREIMFLTAGMGLHSKIPEDAIDPVLLPWVLSAMSRYERALAIDASCGPAKRRLLEMYVLAVKLDVPNEAKWVRKVRSLLSDPANSTTAGGGR